MGVTARRPAGRIDLAELPRRDGELLAVLDRGFGEAARRAGSRLLCAPGCSDCCHGPFPITRLDVWRLRRGLAALAAGAPEGRRRAAAIVERAARAVGLLIEDYPGDPSTGRLADDEKRLDRFFARHDAMPCPVLDPRTGRCELYDSRPVSCRSYGPPLRFDGVDAPPCPLCFQGSDSASVDRCRLEPDPQGLEETILGRMGQPAGETLIAFAVAREENSLLKGQL